ncbi:hypothetical protein, partial [Pseudomonas sp. HMWF006]|uniref:hypothetical protein n=1 Tax=Pseudomonas sp. HMWF006 TaxID=2056843 RepID=UPI001C479914
AAQPNGDKSPRHRTSVSLKNLFESIAVVLRQLVTRQTTTQFIGKNGTTLLTLLDPDQDPRRN